MSWHLVSGLKVGGFMSTHISLDFPGFGEDGVWEDVRCSLTGHEMWLCREGGSGQQCPYRRRDSGREGRRDGCMGECLLVSSEARAPHKLPEH